MFFRVCTEVSVDSYIKQKAVGGSPATGIFSPIDAFSRLIVLMIKYHADPTGANNEQAKVHYRTKILSIVVLVLAQSHEELGVHFQQKPFFRLFSSLLHDLHATESSLGHAYVQTLLAISNTLNTLQPSFFPRFTFSWMSLVSHRLFMPKLLEADQREGWGAFHRLFASLLRFLSPLLRNAELQDTSRQLYRGTLRILLILLHDFPEFLCDYHQSLCDLVPASCIQLRNLILSAFPRNRRLPDPFSANMQLSLLPEVGRAPHIASDYLAALNQVEGLLAAIDAHFDQERGANLSGQLVNLLKQATRTTAGIANGSSKDEVATTSHALDMSGSGINVGVINSLVLHLGVRSIESRHRGNEDSGAAVLRWLVTESEPEARFLVLTAAANQLRFPSSHTAYFSSALVRLFGEAEEELVREQIVRVLLERLIINRPHPWGLLVTFIELMKTQRHRIPRAPAEIQALLDHIAATLSASNINNSNGNGSEEGQIYQQPVHINGHGGFFPPHLLQQQQQQQQA